MIAAVSWRHVAAIGVLVMAVLFNIASAQTITGFPESSSRNDIVPGQFFTDPPTLQNLGFRWYVDGDGNRNAAVEVSYREQGTTTWLEAQPMHRVRHEIVDDDYRTGNLFAGSVMFLEPGTTYEVRFVMSDPDGGAPAEARVETVTTRSEPQAWTGGNTIHVGTSDSLMDAYNSALPGDIIQLSPGLHSLSDRPYLLTRSGEPGKPIVFRGAGSGRTVLEGPDRTKHLFCINADHIMFEDMTIRTGNSFIITALNALDSTGELALDANYEGTGASNITVRRCRIEDVISGMWTCSKNSRNWYVADNVITGVNTSWYPYPDGWTSHVGVNIYGQGHVACHNRITWFGGLLSTSNGGPNPDPDDLGRHPVNTDFYNNDLFYTLGDSIRTDFSAHNIRVYRNRSCNAYFNVSVQPSYGGPIYLMRNELYGATSFKWNNQPAGIIALHNTIGGSFYTGPHSNSHLRNNLFFGGVLSTTLAPELHTMDYDGFGGNLFHWTIADGPQITYTSLAAFTAATGYEEHGIHISLTDFVNASEQETGVTYTADDFDFRLKSTSNAIDNALLLYNINDDYLGSGPDRGAIEFGAERPLYGPRVELDEYVPPLPGDANLDGRVDLQDFGILKFYFGTDTGATWEQGDFNEDGDVDLADFYLLKANFGTTQ